MEEAGRRTWYHCESNPPENLAVSLRGMCQDRQFLKRGYFANKGHVVNAIQGSRTRDSYGDADMFVRFLLNHKVLLETQWHVVYFDAERAKYIKQCCIRGCRPEPPKCTDEERIAQLVQAQEEARVRAKTAAAAKRQQEEKEVERAMNGHAKSESAMEHAAEPSVPTVEAVSETAAQAEQIAPVEPTAPTAEAVAHERVLYLVRGAELQVWEEFLRQVERSRDDPSLDLEVIEEHLVKRFEQAGIISPASYDEDEDSRYYVLNQPLGKFLVKPIAERDVRTVSQSEMQVINRLLAGEFVMQVGGGSMHVQIANWLAQNFPYLKVNTVYSKLFGYKEGDPHRGYGIFTFEYDEALDRKVWLRAVQGFEAFTFRAREEEWVSTSPPRTAEPPLVPHPPDLAEIERQYGDIQVKSWHLLSLKELRATREKVESLILKVTEVRRQVEIETKRREDEAQIAARTKALEDDLRRAKAEEQEAERAAKAARDKQSALEVELSELKKHRHT